MTGNVLHFLFLHAHVISKLQWVHAFLHATNVGGSEAIPSRADLSPEQPITEGEARSVGGRSSLVRGQERREPMRENDEVSGSLCCSNLCHKWAERPWMDVCARVSVCAYSLRKAIYGALVEVGLLDWAVHPLLRTAIGEPWVKPQECSIHCRLCTDAPTNSLRSDLAQGRGVHYLVCVRGGGGGWCGGWLEREVACSGMASKPKATYCPIGCYILANDVWIIVALLLARGLLHSWL